MSEDIVTPAKTEPAPTDEAIQFTGETLDGQTSMTVEHIEDKDHYVLTLKNPTRREVKEACKYYNITKKQFLKRAKRTRQLCKLHGLEIVEGEVIYTFDREYYTEEILLVIEQQLEKYVKPE